MTKSKKPNFLKKLVSFLIQINTEKTWLLKALWKLNIWTEKLLKDYFALSLVADKDKVCSVSQQILLSSLPALCSDLHWKYPKEKSLAGIHYALAAIILRRLTVIFYSIDNARMFPPSKRFLKALEMNQYGQPAEPSKMWVTKKTTLLLKHKHDFSKKLINS